MSAIQLPFLDKNTAFPTVDNALDNPDGLLAAGGDLSTARLVDAYKRGIFPWFSDDDPILWWSPSKRTIITHSSFHASKSLKKLWRKNHYEVSVNLEFERVVTHCAEVPRLNQCGEHDGTWITEDMQLAYVALHQQGYAHSIEVWCNKELIGGLYGVVTDGVFCGESMFHLKDNASKIALMALQALLSPYNDSFIDCQLSNPHLHTLGAFNLNRTKFLSMLDYANKRPIPRSVWTARMLS